MQGIQALLPERPVVAEPFIDLFERFGTQAVNTPLRLLSHLNEADLS